MPGSPEAHFGAPPVVFVVDDDPQVRESLELLITSAGWRAELCATAREFLERPRTRVPACLVLDMWLPDLNGLELQKRIAGDREVLPIVFVAEYGDVGTVVRAMKAGAVDFLTRPHNEGPLLAAVASAIDRSREALRRDGEASALRNRYALLTPREREVLALVTAGLLNKQVGFELGISEITVKAHRGKVMRKMRARSLAKLVEMAGRLGIRSPVPVGAAFKDDSPQPAKAGPTSLVSANTKVQETCGRVGGAMDEGNQEGST